jgi:cephalosporin hydroxylase
MEGCRAMPRLALPSSVRRRVVARVDAFVVRRYSNLARRAAPGEAVDAATLRAVNRLARRVVADGVPARDVDDGVGKAFRALAEGDLSRARPSPAVRRAVVDQFHRLYYHRPKRTWQNTRFLGVDVWKTPLDLWVYQEMLHELRPDVLIETGTKFGGSAYYFARLFDLIGHGRVVTIDVEPQPDRPEHERITYLTGSSTDEEIVARVDALVDGGRPLVVLDSSHHRDHVLAELELWSPRVPVGSYIVVEDTHADGHPISTRFGRGPWDAVDRFLAATSAFEIDESRHKFFMTFNRRGYLRRVRA